MNQQDAPPHATLVPRLSALNGLIWPSSLRDAWREWTNLDLTMPQFKLLLTIASGDGPRVSDLAQRLGVTPPTVTAVLDRLVEHGLVRRTDDQRDRRQVICLLTSQGAELLRRLRFNAWPEVVECLADLAAEEIECLLVGLEALDRAWRARHAHAANGAEPEAC
ncbi:MAG TPA: MarR family transcriptional regulator [Chloroflexota bacterium]|nr:MarR family transcriptional regulator [Chloroflexota bacterium]